MFLYRVVDSLDKAGVPYAIVGGYALVLHGVVRGTVDIDLILALSEKNFLGAEKAFKSVGLVSRLPLSAKEVFHFREEYIKKRNLVAWSFHNLKDPLEIVDVILTQDLKGTKSVKVRAGERTLNVLCVQDLIAMKKRSGRPQDLDDIRALERVKK